MHILCVSRSIYFYTIFIIIQMMQTRRLQDTLRARVDQWTSFFELSQDILKQSLQNCQVWISLNHHNVDVHMF